MHTFRSDIPAIVMPADIPLPARKFDPKVYHVSQEEALEAVSELDQKKFNMMGSIEQYSGIHPKHGRCIIIITAMSDSTIIPMT